MTRIILDTYIAKDKQLFGDDPYSILNTKIQAVNRMYGWLNEQGILDKVTFELKHYDRGLCFAFDAEDLKPYRSQMVQSGIKDADLAVQHIFDERYTPCLYSGVIQLTWPMFSYRDVDGCVGKSWECDLIKGLNTKAIYEVNSVKEAEGIKAAAKALFGYYIWNEPQQGRTPLTETIQHAECNLDSKTTPSDKEKTSNNREVIRESR